VVVKACPVRVDKRSVMAAFSGKKDRCVHAIEGISLERTFQYRKDDAAGVKQFYQHVS